MYDASLMLSIVNYFRTVYENNFLWQIAIYGNCYTSFDMAGSPVWKRSGDYRIAGYFRNRNFHTSSKI